MNDLAQRGDQSESLANLLEALSKAQESIDNVSQDRKVKVPLKDRANPGSFKGHYEFRYATLAAILTHVRPILTENGIWYTQRIAKGDMVTRLFHKSGEWMDTGHIPMPDIKGSPQDIGSTVSFFKRYSLSEALGIASEEDVDGGEDVGGREVSFKAQGAPRARGGGSGVEEPEQGWGEWVREFIRNIQGKETLDALDLYLDENRHLTEGLKEHDPLMRADIVKAFNARRGVLDKDAAI